MRSAGACSTWPQVLQSSIHTGTDGELELFSASMELLATVLAQDFPCSTNEFGTLLARQPCRFVHDTATDSVASSRGSLLKIGDA